MVKIGPHELLRHGERVCGREKLFLTMAKVGAAFITLALCPSIKTQAASFDCGKATTKVEKMICANFLLYHYDYQNTGEDPW